MSPEDQKIRNFYNEFAINKAMVDRAFAEAMRRIDAVKAEEEAKIKQIITRAQLNVEANASRNLPPGYLRNALNRISDWRGFGR